jgi:hypothetical protein
MGYPFPDSTWADTFARYCMGSESQVVEQETSRDGKMKNTFQTIKVSLSFRMV